MAKKPTTVFVCNECGYESPKWMGQCICGAWNSFTEEKVLTASPAGNGRGSLAEASAAGLAAGRKASGGRAKSVARPLSEVSAIRENRVDTGIGELNRVLGGGIVPGSLMLIAGEPGIGKSTLILQAALSLAGGGQTVLYVSGEESEEQIRMRADRLAGGAFSDKLYILSETNIEALADALTAARPSLLIVDSVQTMYTDTLDSVAGTVSQVRACTGELMRLAKTSDIPVFIVAHVTKAGELAGPKIIEHLVDCVLQFTGDRNQDLRILRANKNRFGTTSEIGAFEMREEGLVEITDLSGSLLESVDGPTEGAVATAVYEGTRPLLLEIQALTAPSGVGFARRTPLGIELARLNMIIAVLERHTRTPLADRDIYVNVVGGIRPDGTSCDLAVALAIYSSVKSVAVPPDVLAIGEIGLTGELRQVKGAEKMVREAAKLGFRRIILPRKSAEKLPEIPGIKITPASKLTEAIRAL
ncbi:MAG: DNA repair protein RadA [Clostridiales Family XIII bacterium]|jgi:DNA repair protein RadA/Sms|nr:DNA repair protein RadA [Clostridiales Family XIII bacterium]